MRITTKQVDVIIIDENGNEYEVVVKDGITLTRQDNTPSKLSCSIMRDRISAQKNNQIVLFYDQIPLFWGVVVQTDKDKYWSNIIAYDQMWYLSRNKGWYVYNNKPLNIICDEIMAMNGLQSSHTRWHYPNYAIPYRAEKNVSYLDMINTAIDLTKQNTGELYHVYDDCKDLRLCSDSGLWELNFYVTPAICEDYKISEDLSETSTEVYVDYRPPNSQGGDTTYQAYAKNKKQYKRFGKLTHTDSAEEGENPMYKAAKLLEEVSEEPVHLSLTGVQACERVRGGTILYVDFYTFESIEYLRGYFRVDTVTFNINGGLMKMDLELTLVLMYNDWSDHSHICQFRPDGKRQQLAFF